MCVEYRGSIQGQQPGVRGSQVDAGCNRRSTLYEGQNVEDAVVNNRGSMLSDEQCTGDAVLSTEHCQYHQRRP